MRKSHPHLFSGESLFSRLKIFVVGENVRPNYFCPNILGLS